MAKCLLLLALGSLTSLAPAFTGAGCARFLAPARAAFFAALVFLVDGRPGAALRFLLRDATLFVALLDMLRLPLLFARVTGLISSWHMCLFLSYRLKRCSPCGRIGRPTLQPATAAVFRMRPRPTGRTRKRVRELGGQLPEGNPRAAVTRLLSQRRARTKLDRSKPR